MTTTTRILMYTGFRSSDAQEYRRTDDVDVPPAGDAYLDHGGERIRLQWCSQAWLDFLQVIQQAQIDVMARFDVALGASRP
ncbi:hypothetical protein [Kitasatospora camelliae]|uniref:DUF397 domain-containing protein n=1 Tax=Kitasatospora camelliae TaxID=3156397 RepID=A0AAU8JW92_9ACTN